jgi:hypothetical protein
MTRCGDWETALHAVLERHRTLSGAWGVSDCWTLTMDAVEAMTGRKALPKLRRYTTEAAGYRLFARQGFKTVTQALASAFEPCGVLSAGRGDIAVVDGPNGPSCGIVTPSGIAIKTIYADGTSALRFEPITAAIAAFKV